MVDIQELTISWLPPLEGKFKLNVDGVSKERSNQAGSRCILRDNGGHWLLGSARNLGYCLPLLAELWEVLMGHELAWEKSFKNPILEINLLSVMELLSDGDHINNPYHVLIRKCKCLLQREWAVEIKHVYIEANN